MAPNRDRQLEKVIGDVLKSGNVQALDAFLQKDISEGTTIKCSQQFLDKLDKFVIRSLEQKDSKSASLGFAIISKCGKNLKLPGDDQGLSGIIAQGLIGKWFEKCRQLWIQCGTQWDETLFNLSEDFFEALLVVHEACKEGTESFLYHLGHLGVDPRIYILIQKEAIRKFNLILDKIPVELKKERNILTSKEASDIMIKLAGQVMKGGDYDFQTALIEALCRMATRDQRKELAHQWFSMEHVATAFSRVHDSEFETDCRKFLNLVNGMQGDRRRVYSYPCLEVYLDKYELLMPADEKLETFWIDFNLGSQSISFYFSSADEEAQGGQWETMCISENEVKNYTVTEEGRRKVLLLNLSEVVVVGALEGSSLTIHFSSLLDVMQAVCSVYGHSKNKDFLGKKSTSVGKTTVKIVMDENSSQVVPESQVSLGVTEKNTAPPVEMVTPAKMRISESTTFISNSTGRSVLDNPARGGGKPSLEVGRLHGRQGEFYLGEQRTVAIIRSHDKTPSSTKAGAMMEQHAAQKKTPKNKADKRKTNMAEALDMVLSREGEEQSLGDSFVPDTQPLTEINVPSNWNKLSVSEMIIMPTQKISTLPRPGLAPQQECPNVAQRLSVSCSGPVSQKQFHTRLTHRLQQVLSEKGQNCAPQEPAAPQRKKSDIRENLKAKSSADQHASTFCTPKEQQPQRNGPTKDMSGLQTSLEENIAPKKSSARASTTKAKQERILHSVEAKTTAGLSSKEKRDAEAAGSMVNLISSHYRFNTRSTGKGITQDCPQNCLPSLVNWPSLNISWFSATKRDVSGAVIKSHSKTVTNSSRQGEDVFAFNADSQLSIGAKDKSIINTSAISYNDNCDSLVLHSTNKKGQPVAKQKTQNVKKQLFSDTDTDCAMTEVSWLRESSRNAKHKVTVYSRQAPVKPKAATPHALCDSKDLPSTNPKPAKESTKPKKKMPGGTQKVEQPKKRVKPAAVSSRLHAAGRRPKRAVATANKSYKEPNTDSSQSESETPPVPKNCFIGQQGKKKENCFRVSDVKTSKKPTAVADRNNQSDLQQKTGLKQRPEDVLKKTLKSKKKTAIPAEETVNAVKDSWFANPASLCLSPFCIDRMRSAERSAPPLDLNFSSVFTPLGSLLLISPDPACQDTPLPIPLLPEPPLAVSSIENSKPSSLYSAQKKVRTPKTQSIQSVHALHLLGSQIHASDHPIGASAAEPSQQCLTGADQSPLSLSTQPLLTSTLLELDKPSTPSLPQLPFPEDTVNHGSHCGFSKASTGSQVSLSQSSTKSSGLMERVKDSPTAALAVSLKTEITATSDSDLKPDEFHESGPSRKRHISLSSNSEEDEKEEKKKSKLRRHNFPRMKPRKLFKSSTEMPAEGKLDRIIFHTVNSSHRENNVGGGEMEMDEAFELSEIAANPSNICHKFSSELKKKIQDRFRVLEIYNKQSLKTVQQHISSFSMQVANFRAQRLEQIKKVLLEEIHKLEQDETVLKYMEKELSIYCKKQTMAFRSYQENETKRNETLKKALQSNVFPSLEYEQKIFTRQMGLIRKDMKSVQDRLLSKMQEGEIQSVKRGLSALFFPDGDRF